MSLPDYEAEALLIKHWDHLKYVARFFQAALYTATKELLKLAGLAFDECPSPAKLLTHLSQRFGIMCNGRCGITRKHQIEAIIPYISILNQFDLRALYSECAKKQWNDLANLIENGSEYEPSVREKWDSRKFISEIEDDRYSGNRWIIHELINGLIDKIAPWETIRDTLMDWAKSSTHSERNAIVIEAIKLFGDRTDLALLEIVCREETQELSEIMTNAKFELRRRTIR